MAKLLKGLNETVKDLEGNDILNERGNPIVLKKLIGNALATSTMGEPIRMLKIAHDIYSCNGKIELEDNDFDVAKTCMTENQNFSNLIKAPILHVFNSAQEIK